MEHSEAFLPKKPIGDPMVVQYDDVEVENTGYLQQLKLVETDFPYTPI